MKKENFRLTLYVRCNKDKLKENETIQIMTGSDSTLTASYVCTVNSYFSFYIQSKNPIFKKHIYNNDIIGSMIGLATLNDL